MLVFQACVDGLCAGEMEGSKYCDASVEGEEGEKDPAGEDHVCPWAPCVWLKPVLLLLVPWP